jgi:hypothetical protein
MVIMGCEQPRYGGVFPSMVLFVLVYFIFIYFIFPVMLSQLKIQDFKNIKAPGVYLQTLTGVNFLVGENGCGKTSVLEYLFQQNGQKSLFLSNEQKLDLFLNKLYGDSKEELMEMTSDTLAKLVVPIWLTEAIKQGKIEFLLVDEPENHLHPTLQKQIPYILESLKEYFQIQIFVATHSPFIVSSSGEITDREKQTSEVSKRNFISTQKVYFIKNGQIANRVGESGIDEHGQIKGSFGYWGSKANFIASRMLGAGLMDLVLPQRATLTKDAPILVFCEGEGKDEDATIYNKIFQSLKPAAMFVSARGSSQLHRTFELIQEIRAGLSANFQMLMLRDRDHDFKNELEIQDFEQTNPNSKVLRRRAIEAYLYSSETLALLLKIRGITLRDKSRRQMNSLQRRIQMEAEEGIPGNSYKSRLRDTFKLILKEHGYWINNRGRKKDLLESISTVIKPGTKTYRELKKCIFG